MYEETLIENEGTVSFDVITFIIGCILIGKGADLLATRMTKSVHKSLVMGSFIRLLLAKLLLNLQQGSSFLEAFFSKILLADISKNKNLIEYLQNGCKI